MEVKEYRSPVRKLLRFFMRSRDGWKRKCQQAKVVVKRLANRSDALTRSRDRWKALAKQQRRELLELRQESQRQKKQEL